MNYTQESILILGHKTNNPEATTVPLLTQRQILCCTAQSPTGVKDVKTEQSKSPVFVSRNLCQDVNGIDFLECTLALLIVPRDVTH